MIATKEPEERRGVSGRERRKPGALEAVGIWGEPVGFTAKRLQDSTQGSTRGACGIYRKAGTELSPGWRLCGTLGTGNKKRTALKERQNQSECRIMKGA
jgi:hypothetical protein